jgi:hypothetical protein
LYATDLKRLGLDRTRANIYSDRRPIPNDFTVLVDDNAREIAQSGRIANGPRINRSTELRLVLKEGSDLVADVDQSLGIAKVPSFMLAEPGFLEVGATFPVFDNEHGVAYTKREHPGINTITVATRNSESGENVQMWEVSLVNQARVNPRGGRSVADNWFVQVREIACNDDSSSDDICFPTSTELDALAPNVGILTWWMPAGPYGQIVARNRNGQYIELVVHFNGWRREVYNGRAALPIRPMPGARIRYTTVREDRYGIREAAGLSFV